MAIPRGLAAAPIRHWVRAVISGTVIGPARGNASAVPDTGCLGFVCYRRVIAICCIAVSAYGLGAGGRFGLSDKLSQAQPVRPGFLGKRRAVRSKGSPKSRKAPTSSARTDLGDRPGASSPSGDGALKVARGPQPVLHCCCAMHHSVALTGAMIAHNLHIKHHFYIK